MPEHTPAPTPSRAVYGFALHLTFNTLFIIYLIWAITPEIWFEHIGITHLPQRYWAIAVPIFLLTLFAIFAFIIYPSLGLYMTPNCDDISTIIDSRSIINENQIQVKQTLGECVCANLSNCEKKNFDNIKNEDFILNSVPTMQDLNILHVSEHLYLNNK